MHRLSRRTFTKQLLLLPLVAQLPGFATDPQEMPAVEVPSSIAGHLLAPDERALAARFLASQEKALAPLRNQELPNSLPPALVYFLPPPGAQSHGS